MSDRIRLSTDEKDPKYRLRLSCDLGIIELADEALTSATKTARVTRRQAAVLLNEDEARWLHGALGELLQEIDAGAIDPQEACS